MRSAIAIACAVCSIAPAAAQTNDPAGWNALVDAIQGTSFNNVSSLNGRHFPLSLSGARPEDTLEVTPGDAFVVGRTGTGQFVITIIDANALVEDGLIQTYRPIGWRIVQTSITGFGAAIEGSATCRYRMQFRQRGGNELDLAALEPNYEVSWEIDRPDAIATIDREGSGLQLTRTAGSATPARLRLRVKQRSGPLDLRTDWIDVPACNSTTPTLTQTPPPTRDPPTRTAGESVSLRVTGVSRCTTQCGGFRITTSVTVTNASNRSVRCDDLVWRLLHTNNTQIDSASHWVELNPQGSTSFDVVMNGPLNLTSWIVSAPNFNGCRYI